MPSALRVGLTARDWPANTARNGQRRETVMSANRSANSERSALSVRGTASKEDRVGKQKIRASTVKFKERGEKA